MSQARGASSAFLIFPPGPADAEALAHVHVTSWRQTYKGLLPDAYLARMSAPEFARRFARELARTEGPLTLAAADRTGLVGYASGGASRRGIEGEAEIAVLYVLSAAQGCGVGRELLSRTARALRDQGFTSLVISVLRENVRARGFYEHLGGLAERPRQEPGPGGAALWEVAYRWADIRKVTG
jgi:ribosomal protein S18 acetylase RimI-like enzyme